MKLNLFSFQQKALNNLRMSVEEARGSYQRTHIPQVISFTAPTGAGKTIVMAALIEDIYCGNGIYVDQPEAIFVWLSDSPDLNEQSKLKIDIKADRIAIGTTVTITDEDFDNEVLEDGHIYFLNTQKLSRSSNLTKKSDKRQYTIWETLQNTINKKVNQLYFIIDEAHRGMQGVEAGKATTIMQKFLKGSENDGIDPMPLVIGMSATIERFNNLVKGTTSTIHNVLITADEVLASGLLKDRIVISYSEESSVSKDMAVLQAATDDWKNKCDHWYQYCYEQHYAQVNPIFVVQVENGNSECISKTDLDTCLKNIQDRTGIKFLRGEVVHTFGQTESTLTIAGLEVAFIEPSRISDDKKIKVVFFKENLSTGWDCPRAETMMSFRSAKDSTYIAQLLGRMVRTPMQMHIQVDDTLNDVHLYLPYFDKVSVNNVIEDLQATEGGNIPTDITGENISNRNLVTLTVRPKSGINEQDEIPDGQMTVFDNVDDSITKATGTLIVGNGKEQSQLESTRLNNININTNFNNDVNRIDSREKTILAHEYSPSDNESTEKYEVDLDFDREAIVKEINESGLLTYNVRNVRINDYLKSLYSIGRLLVQSGLDKKATETIQNEIINKIRLYIENLQKEGIYDSLLEEAREFKLGTQIFDAFGEVVENESNLFTSSFISTDIDIDRQFRLAEARLGNEGIGNIYLNTYFKKDHINNLKIDVILFATDSDCITNLNVYAKETFHKLNDIWRRHIPKLNEKLRRQYERIVSDGDVVSKHNFRLPETITVSINEEGKKYSNHLFVNDNGYTTIKLNSWEEVVLREEFERDDFICWIRNSPRASWALCIPYELNGEKKPMYPDFIIVRRDKNFDDSLIIDLLEPHNPEYKDNLPKAKGLAEYARQNPGVGRIELIREGQDAAGVRRFKRLDMSKMGIRDKVMQAQTDEELMHIFDTDGTYGRTES